MGKKIRNIVILVLSVLLIYVGFRIVNDQDKLIEDVDNLSYKLFNRYVFKDTNELNNYELKDASLYNTNCFYVALKSNYSSFYREEYYNTRDEQNKINYSVIKIPLPYFFILLDCYLVDIIATKERI